MTTKLLLVGDFHFRSTTPEIRTETNFDTVCLSKMEWICNYATINECDAILQAGDLFNQPVQSPKLMGSLMALLNDLSCEFITVPGNHDCPGRNCYQWREESFLGILASTAGNINVLDDQDSIVLNTDVEIYGFGFGQLTTQAFLEGKTNLKGKKFTVAIAHASVGEDEGEHRIATLNPKADMVLWGDIHSGWREAYEHKSGCFSFNPGAVIRQKSQEMNMHPMVTLVTIEDKKLVEYQEIEIPHTPSEYAFNKERYLERISDKSEAFLAAFLKAKAMKTESSEDLLTRIAKGLNMDHSVVVTILDKLKEIKSTT